MSKYSMSDDMMFESNGQARFIVFGVGGGGGNAVEHMVQQGVRNVTFICANTDLQALNMLTVPNKMQLGEVTTRGLGAGANPEVGREAAEGDEDQIRAVLEGYDMIFITAGMGGGTGTGAAPVVARIAKEMGILTVAVVTTPFDLEGKKRAMAAKSGIEQLSQYVDSIIIVPNQKLLKVYRQMNLKDAFKRSNDVLLNAVNGLVQIVTTDENTVINTDFNDVRTAMTEKGYAMMGIGRASGEDRAREATEKAIRSPLLDDLRLENAQGLLINVTGDLMLGELEEVAAIVDSIIDLENGNIFYGAVSDESMGDELQVTVIATGLTLDDSAKPAGAQSIHQSAPVDHESALSKARQPQAQVQTQAAPTRPVAKPISVGTYLQQHQQKN
ncbi:cell division protein FtsZ [Moraxella caviae]|uniref:Cell division protein FtsZ n=1 Tax=Moraxella caviae TaxID=34060 RepID=A0A1T0A6B4_9GAMM|nr:cell division protein FtsZ [Moraxella caviae]OOR91332.1 cell division protein FtsZ [Moraxella caviae]STZ13942.1 Cell division protein FtsZ [Moraxella caviae]VEW11122.1 Cell division protein FtsZ [Moraxella caviae]